MSQVDVASGTRAADEVGSRRETKPAALVPPAGRRARLALHARRRRQLGLALAFPAIAIVLMIIIVPLFEAAYYSLTSWNGLTAQYIGFSSYTQLFFHTVGINQILENNLWVVLCIPVGLSLALMTAFLTALRVTGWKLFRSVVFFPVALSWVVIGIVFSSFLASDGGLNQLLRGVGLGRLAQDWLGNPTTALPALLGTFTWAMFGINTVIFISGLATIPPDLFDAARVDGAGSFKVLRHIVLPIMRRFVQLAFIVTLISGFTGIFGLIYVMTSGGPGFSTTTLEFQVYQEAFALGNFGTAAAMGMVLFLAMVIVTLIVSRLGGRSSGGT